MATDHDRLVAAAAEVLRLEDAHRDAMNGLGHPGEDHDTALCRTREVIHSQVSHCAGCIAAQYGIEVEQTSAWGDLREALGGEREPWDR